MSKKIVLKNGKTYGWFYGNCGFDKNKNKLEFSEDEVLEIVEDNKLSVGDTILDHYKGCVGKIVSKRYSTWAYGWKYMAELDDGRRVEFSEGYGYRKLYD